MFGSTFARSVLFGVVFGIAVLPLLGCPKPQVPAQQEPPAEPPQSEPVEPQENIPSPGAPLAVGTKFPMFAAWTTGGEMLSLGDLLAENAYVLVWFWATWGIADPSYLDPLVKIYEESEGERFHLVTINLDEEEYWGNVEVFIQAGGFAFPIVTDYDHDPSASLARAYSVGRHLGNYVLGPDGVILLKDIKVEDAIGIVDALTQAEEPYTPISATVGISEMMESSASDEPVRLPVPGQPARVPPESLMVTLTVDNPQAGAEGTYPANFVYEVLAPTGDITYLEENPANPESTLRRDEQGPIAFHVVSLSETKELDNTAVGSTASVLFYLIPPRETYLIRYWVEVWSPVLGRFVTGGDGIVDFARLPWCTEEEVEHQSGIIPVGP